MNTDSLNLQLDPELARQLARSNDVTVCRTIAKNPNTPSDVLLALIGRFPDEVLHNPVLPLLLLEDPQWFSQIRLFGLQLARVVFHIKFPAQFVLDVIQTHLEDCDWSMLDVLLHPKVPKSMILHWLANVPFTQSKRILFFALMQHPQATTQEILANYRLYHVRDKCWFAQYDKTPSCLLELLLTDESPEVRARASRHPNAPREILSLLYRAGASFDLSEFTPAQALSTQELSSLREMGALGAALWARHPTTDVRLLSFRNNLLWLAALISRPDLPRVLAEKICLQTRARRRRAGLLREEAREYKKYRAKKTRVEKGKTPHIKQRK